MRHCFVLLLSAAFVIGCGKAKPDKVVPEAIRAEGLNASLFGRQGNSGHSPAVTNKEVSISCRFQNEGVMPEKLLVKIIKEQKGKKPLNVQTGNIAVRKVGDNEYELAGTLRPVKKPGKYTLRVTYHREIITETAIEIVDPD